MPRAYQWDSMTEFGTLNTDSHTATLPPDNLPVLRNFEFAETKSLRKRKGVGLVNGGGGANTVGALGAVNKKMMGRQTTGSTDRIFFFNNSHVWVSALDGTNCFEILVGGAAITNAQYGVQGFDGNYFIVRSAGAIISVAAGGTVGVAVGNIQGTFTVIFKDRQFIFDQATPTPNDSRLDFSQLLDNSAATGFPGTNNLFVSKGDGQELTSMIVYNDQLYLFKNRSSYVLSADGSPSAWTLRQLHPYIGCVASQSPHIIEGLLYFLSEEGVYRTDGVTFDEISKPVRNEFVNKSYIGLSTFNLNAAYFENKYIIYDRATHTAMVYDINVEQWSKWEFSLNINGFDRFLVTPDTSPNYLYAGTATDANIWRMGDLIYQDSGNNYDATIRQSMRVADGPTQFKRHAFTDIDCRIISGTISSMEVNYYKDRSVGGTQVLTLPTTAGIDRVMVRSRSTGKFRFLSYGLEFNSSGPFELFGIHHAFYPSDGVVNAH